MPELESYRACPICGRTACRVLMDRSELAAEARFRDRLFKRALPPGTPDAMLDDLTVFTNAYEAQLVVCDCGLVARDPRFAPDAAVRAYAQDDYADEWLEQSFQEYRQAFRERLPELTRRIGPS